MDPSILRSVWPVFSAEAREQIQQIGEQVLALELDPSERDPELVTVLKRQVHSLKGSAASLGLTDIERLVHAVEDQLAKDPQGPAVRAFIDTTLRSLTAIEGALAQGDRGETPVVAHLTSLLRELDADPGRAAGGASGVELAAFKAEALDVLAGLEGSLGALMSPHVPDRVSRVHAAVEVADGLTALATQVGALGVAKRGAVVASCFAQLTEPGDAASRAASELAGELVNLRIELEAHGEARAAPAAHVPLAAGAVAQGLSAEERAGPARGGEGDRQVRVSVKTLESLALQVEQLVAGRAQMLRRDDQHRDLLDGVQQALLTLERAMSEARVSAGATAGAAANAAGLEPLRNGLGHLRRLQKNLLDLMKSSHREAEQLGLITQVVRDDLRDLRMVPASQVLDPLRRAVRETSARLHKDVELVLAGGDTRLDRRILEQLRDPLMHLVRNAIDHGIEPADTRRLAGKPARGRIEVRVEARGARIAVVVADDGGGLDPERVRASAVRKGLLAPDAAARLSEAEARRLVFLPGFSTRTEVTEISGRGVGLDVVASTAARLQGSVDVDSVAGQGTRFTIDLPLTLAAGLGLLVRAGTTVAALPADAVRRVLRLAPEEVGTVAGRVLAQVEGQQLPFHALSESMGLARLPLALDSKKRQPALLLALGAERAVFAVDEVLGQQEIVVRPLGRHVGSVPHLAGATMLDDGRLVPVLNASALLRVSLPGLRGVATGPGKPRILVADDSLTTRFAMKSLLEIAGYPVVTASDGEEAWAVLERSGAQLVVSDWQMPRLEGPGLARRMKAHPSLSRVPIILVTSLDSPEDRAQGLESGADGYLVKKDVERGKLLELVRQLLPSA